MSWKWPSKQIITSDSFKQIKFNPEYLILFQKRSKEA